jgi:hypothetical protein
MAQECGRLYSLGDRVKTVKGVGTVVDIEAWTDRHDTVPWDSPKAQNWRYGVKHDQKTDLNYDPAYFFPRDLEKLDEAD